LFIDVGDDTGWIGGYDRVDVGFDEGSRIELMIAETLIEFLLFCFNLLAGVLSVPISR